MTRLVLMRHAKAVRAPGMTDHDRPLAGRGRTDAVLVADWLQAHGFAPDLVIASDSARTRETMNIVLPRFSPLPAARLEPGLYLAEAEEILAVAQTAPAPETLMLIGHNPGIAELAVALTGVGEPEDVRRIAASFPTSAAAILEFDGPLREARELQGRLLRFIWAKTLREAAPP